MKASVFVGTSLDGFIARADGSFDFLPAEVEPHGYEEFMATVDALVIGRKTFETALGFDEWVYGTGPLRRPGTARVRHRPRQMRFVERQCRRRERRHRNRRGRQGRLHGDRR